jgi:hypothetical protein
MIAKLTRMPGAPALVADGRTCCVRGSSESG